MFIFYPIIEIFILDIENTFIKIEEKKKRQYKQMWRENNSNTNINK